MIKKIVISPRAISIKKASARAVNTVIAKCLYNRGAYVGVLSAWSLCECEDLDRLFAPEIRRRTKNLRRIFVSARLRRGSGLPAHIGPYSAYGDLVQWDTQLQSWSWREVLHGPRSILERALPILPLPTDLAVPLLPGQAWHLTTSSFLAASAKRSRRFFMSPRRLLLQALLSRSYTVTGIFPTQSPPLLDPQYFAIPPLFGRTWVPP